MMRRHYLVRGSRTGLLRPVYSPHRRGAFHRGERRLAPPLLLFLEQHEHSVGRRSGYFPGIHHLSLQDPMLGAAPRPSILLISRAWWPLLRRAQPLRLHPCPGIAQTPD
eukprot:4965751-Pyramimonas_sp.AAC.1